MKLERLILILLIGIPSWYFTDMESASRVYAYVLPIISFICLLGFCLWLIDLFSHIGEQRKANQDES